MAELNNTFFKINDSDVVRKTSQVKQLVDILQVDVASVDDENAPSSSNNTKTRKKYEVFVSGTGTNAVTSSLFQTIFDQDYTT
ncbi:MAG: hypothetical protein CMO23_07225, partial [Thiotrichales bacterium]|nr:hypothetical protein [Thiotrichales bacterium]